MPTQNEVVFVTAYTPTIEKIDLLRDLIKKIKSFGYEVCLATHSPTPQDIVDRCDYFIYDKKNELNYDSDICYWINHITDKLRVDYKQYGAMATHIIPIVRLIIGGMAYLKSLNVKKVYLLEYDVILHTDDVFKRLEEDLDSFDVSGFYTEHHDNMNKFLLLPHGINLDAIEITNLTTESSGLIDIYREYFNQHITPITERIIYDYLWANLKIKWNELNLIESSITQATSDSRIYAKNTFLFTIYNECVYFFCMNNTGDNWKFDIILNNSTREIEVPSHSWLWEPMEDPKTLKKIKVILNNVFVKEIDLSVQSDYDLLSKWSRVELFN